MAVTIDPLEEERIRREQQAQVPRASSARVSTTPPEEVPPPPVVAIPSAAVSIPRTVPVPDPAVASFLEQEEGVSRPDRLLALSADIGAGAGAGAPDEIEIAVGEEEGAAPRRVRRTRAQIQAQRVQEFKEFQARGAGLTAEERLAQARLRDPRQRELEQIGIERAQRRRPGAVVTRRGTVTRGPRSIAERIAISEGRRIEPVKEAIARDFETLRVATLRGQAVPRTLEEHTAQFRKVLESAGAAGAEVPEAVQRSFVASMPPNVRREYEERLRDIKAQQEADREAQRARIVGLAQAAVGGEAARRRAAGVAVGEEEVAVSPLGISRRERRVRERREDVIARAEAEEEAARRVGPSRLVREGKKLDVLRGKRVEELRALETERNELSNKFVGDELAREERKIDQRLKAKKREVETVERQREALSAEFAEPRAARAVEREQAILRGREEVAAEVEPAARARAVARAREIEAAKRTLPPGQQAQVSAVQSTITRAQRAFDRANKAFEEARKVQRFKSGRRILSRPPDPAEVQAAREQRDAAFQRLKFHESQLTELTGVSLEIPDVGAGAGALPAVGIERTPRTEALDDYEKRFERAQKGLLTDKEMRRLDKAWIKTGRPKEEAPHRPGPAPLPETEFAPGITEQQAGVEPQRSLTVGPFGIIVPEGLTQQQVLAAVRSGKIEPATALNVAKLMNWIPQAAESLSSIVR